MIQTMYVHVNYGTLRWF